MSMTLTDAQRTEARAMVQDGIDKTFRLLRMTTTDEAHPLAVEGTGIQRLLDETPLTYEAAMQILGLVNAWNLKVASRGNSEGA